MKNTLFAILTITLLSCGGAKEINETSTPAEEPIDVEFNILINDIWVAETILGERFEPNGNKMPQLEFQVKENRFGGNDGCNSLGGSLKKLDNENLVFGPIMATKMACPDMEVSRQFNQALSETQKYRIMKLRLYLMDSEGNDLMVLKKVD
jgi:heat shock protein HslJ|tara:strand:- start:3450 stop:3902 length:453 start_codon:yes stop_codon:yes gene_type:complete